jgi:hypothetical protein
MAGAGDFVALVFSGYWGSFLTEKRPELEVKDE